MPPHSDPRWSIFVHPGSFEDLEEMASAWADLVPQSLNNSGSVKLLRLARSLFVHAWFDYEFLAVAALVGFQAMETAFRELYPGAERPFRSLVRQAHQERILSNAIADLAMTGIELRNLYSHPLTQYVAGPGQTGSMLENTHRMVVLVCGAAEQRHA